MYVHVPDPSPAGSHSHNPNLISCVCIKLCKQAHYFLFLTKPMQQTTFSNITGNIFSTADEVSVKENVCLTKDKINWKHVPCRPPQVL